MRAPSVARVLAALVFVLAFTPVRAEGGKPELAAAKASGAGPASQLPQDSVTAHTIVLDGKQLPYEATAGTLPLSSSKGEEEAKIFYVSYTATNAGARPITFAFNGGPGAAAAFLHMGALGPRIVPFQDNGAAPLRPVRVADNPDSWLAFTDLVFIDPVGTGYSRATTGDSGEKAYWGVEKDIDSVAEAVRLYLLRSGRELAPIYLAGESYGGFRAAELSDRLLSMGFAVEGTVMISPALEFSMLQADSYAILPLTFALPSLTAANVEMHEGPKAPLDSVHEAEDFARRAYLLHLADGLKQDDAVISALSKLTGLDRTIVARHHGRVSASLFIREYLRESGRALSRYDATVSVPLPEPTDHPRFDPVLDGAVSVLAPATAGYISGELGFKTGLEYRLLNREVSGHWDFGVKPNQQGYAGSLDSLEQARVRNPSLKIFIAHGYTDLVTPYAMSRYLVSQLRPIDGAAEPRLRIYRGGHMMYLRPASRASLSRDIRGIFEVGGPR
jgi:carboxypeptidase C (cathepsin A)